MLITLIAILLTFILVIGIHELGHALTARWFNVKIQRIGFGFGKPLWSFKNQKGREFIIGRWPLGGYVRLLNTRIEPVSKEDEDNAFDKKPRLTQALILLSGGLMNFLFALLALFFFFLMGFPSQRPVVLSVTPQSIMDKALVKAGDEFQTIAQTPIKTWADVGMALATAVGQQRVSFQVSNPQIGTRDLVMDLSKMIWHPNQTFIEQFGITIDKSPTLAIKIPGESFTKAISHAFKTFFQLVVFFVVMIKQLLLKNLPFSLLLGPIGIMALTIKTFIQGLAIYLHFVALLSISIGLINLLPLPSLDGGSLVYLLIEKIRGKPISVAFEILLYRLAFITFIVFLVQLLLNDLQHWVSGKT